MDKALYSVITICIIGLAALAFPLADQLGDRPANTYFAQSLLPELLSMCLDGLLFVGVLTMVQRAAERRELMRLRNAVMKELNYLEEVMINCLCQSDLGNLRGTKIDFRTSASLAETMKKLNSDAQQLRIESRKGSYPNDTFSLLAKSVSDAVVKKAKVHLRRLEALTPVTAQFGDGFLSNWLSLHDQLFSLTREEGFDQSEIDSWGKNMPFEYYYGRVADLFHYLNVLQVKACA
jgi:hypothetical protein